MAKTLFKEIPLFPTLFSLDVWVSRDKRLLAEEFHKRYGESVEYYLDEYHPNQAMTLDSTRESELKGKLQLVITVESFDVPTLVHELHHVLWHLSKYCGVEMKFESQEWGSCMIEYLIRNCLDKKTFKTIDRRNDKLPFIQLPGLP